MSFWLAYAEPTDLSDSNWQVVLVVSAVLAAVAVLAMVPIGVARKRASRRAGGILAASVLWAVLTAGSMVQTVLARYQWARDRNLDLRTGYGQAQGQGAAPGWPWAIWVVLAACYAALLAAGWLRRTRGQSPGPGKLPPG